MAMVTSVAAVDVGGVDPWDPGVKPAEDTPWTTRLVELTDVTFPLAKLKPLPPPGIDPEGGLGGSPRWGWSRHRGTRRRPALRLPLRRSRPRCSCLTSRAG